MRNLVWVTALWTAGGVAGLAWAAIPEPAAVPVSWELNMRFQDPRRVVVLVPGQARPVVYWYMLYEVENPVDREVDFYPRFDLVTDTMRVVRSEVQVSPEAFQAIYRQTGDPRLVPPEKVLGRLLRGRDQARHSVAIWRDFDPAATAFTVYVSGLSGEVARLKNPRFDPTRPESDGNARHFVLRKTLAIPYRIPGSESTRAMAVPQRQPGNQKWIMR